MPRVTLLLQVEDCTDDRARRGDLHRRLDTTSIQKISKEVLSTALNNGYVEVALFCLAVSSRMQFSSMQT